MKLFGGVIPVTGTTFLMFCLFAVLFVGYALGRIKVKGISLGDAAVFVIALVFGALLFEPLSAQLVINGNAEAVNFTEKALDIIEKVGLIFFALQTMVQIGHIFQVFLYICNFSFNSEF